MLLLLYYFVFHLCISGTSLISCSRRTSRISPKRLPNVPYGPTDLRRASYQLTDAKHRALLVLALALALVFTLRLFLPPRFLSLLQLFRHGLLQLCNLGSIGFLFLLLHHRRTR